MTSFDYPGTAQETIELELCEGEPFDLNGMDIFESTDVMLTAASGCDSLLSIVITNFPEATETISGTFCEGTSISVFGMDISTDTNDIFFGTASTGCDSTVIVDIDFQDFATFLFEADLCPGQSEIIEGVTFDEDAFLFDPQTQGGLLISVSGQDAPKLMSSLPTLGFSQTQEIGRIESGLSHKIHFED